MMECEEGNIQRVYQELEKNPSKINAQNNHGYTAILIAVKYSHPEIVQYLINTGADVNITNNVKYYIIICRQANQHYL